MNRILRTNRLLLQPIEESHAPILLDFVQRNKLYFKQWSPAYSDQFFSLNYQLQVIQNDTRQWNLGVGFKFYIFSNEDGNNQHILGSVTLSNVVRGPLQSCFLGYKIDEKVTNKGLATEAIAHITRFAFEKLSLHRVEANIMPDNAASIRVIEKLGFQKEGYSKDYLKINGKWQDHYRFALLSNC